MKTMSDYDYERIERKRFNDDISEIEKSPLSDRKNGVSTMRELIASQTRLKHLAGMLIDGSYGAGAKFAFESMSKRMNRRAWIFITLAQLECRTSNRYARELWRDLPKEKQDEINLILDEVIHEHENAI